MPVFAYKALKSGNYDPVNARLEAKDIRHAKQQLRDMGMLVQSLEQEQDQRAEDALKKLLLQFSFSLPEKQLLVFVQQLAVVLEAGIPLIESLFILEQQTTNPKLQQILAEVRQEVINGKIFSEAMAQTGAFDRLFITMLKTGESTGELDNALFALYELRDKAYKLRGRVQKAMTMPAIAGLVIFGVIILMLTFVIPQFQEFFSSQGDELPFITTMMITLSKVVCDFWWIVILVTAGVCIWFNIYRQGIGKPVVDHILIKIPVVGGLVTRVYTLRFISTLNTLISGGVILTEALDKASATIPNLDFQNAFVSAKETLMKGGAISKTLEKEGIFPPMVTKMMSIGEQTGEFEKMLKKTIGFMDDEVDAAMHAMTEMIQPLMTVVGGGIILFMFAAIYLPIFQIAKGG
jgi:type IV pilus assembly protein PilC